MRIALVLAALLATQDLATAKCAMPKVGSQVLTATGAKVAADGGVLVGSQNSWDIEIGGAEDAINKTWRFSDGKKQYEPVLVTIAPGLVVYQPPKGVTGTLTLLDGTTERAKLDRIADTPGKLAAPAIKSVKQMRVEERYGGFRFELHATLKTTMPKGAIAIVVFGVTKTGTVARSWAAATEGQTKAQVAGSAGRCDPGVPGEVMSKVGEKVVLAYVDASGRLSALSKPIVVTRGKP
jgi:hypothetical protein